MSKELEALNEIKNHKIKVDVNIKYNDGNETQYRFETIRDMFPNQFDIIETALKNQVNLELANKTLQMNIDLGVALAKGLQKKLDESTKKLKALEIIKEKNVNVRAFKKVLLMKQNDDVKLRAYNSQNDKDEDDLTKEEFDLLKEVLL